MLEGRGFSSREIAWVMVLSPVCNALVPPLWGLLADLYSARVALLRLAVLGSAAGALALAPAETLPAVLLAMAAYCFFRAPIFPLADVAAHVALPGQGARFATIRVWGSAGFAAFAAVAGALEASRTPLLLCGLAAAAYLVSTAGTLHLPSARLARRPGLLREVGPVVTAPAFLLLAAGNALHYVAHGAYDVYFGLYVRAAGHGDPFLGLAWVVAVSAEVGLMLVAPRLFGRARTSVLLAVGSGAAAVRFLLLGSVTGVFGLLAAQTLHALSFGLWYLSMVKHVQDSAPEHLRTTAQGAAQAAMGLGMIVGYLGGGEIFGAFGGARLFQAAAGAASLAVGCYAWMAARERG